MSSQSYTRRCHWFGDMYTVSPNVSSLCCNVVYVVSRSLERQRRRAGSRVGGQERSAEGGGQTERGEPQAKGGGSDPEARDRQAGQGHGAGGVSMGMVRSGGYENEVKLVGMGIWEWRGQVGMGMENQVGMGMERSDGYGNGEIRWMGMERSGGYGNGEVRWVWEWSSQVGMGMERSSGYGNGEVRWVWEWSYMYVGQREWKYWFLLNMVFIVVDWQLTYIER